MVQNVKHVPKFSKSVDFWLSYGGKTVIFCLTDTLRVDFNKVAHPKWPNGTKVGSSVVDTKETLAAKRKFSPLPILAGNSNSKVGHSL